jgi:hypothetical protein
MNLFELPAEQLADINFDHAKGLPPELETGPAKSWAARERSRASDGTELLR